MMNVCCYLLVNETTVQIDRKDQRLLEDLLDLWRPSTGDQ